MKKSESLALASIFAGGCLTFVFHMLLDVTSGWVLAFVFLASTCGLFRGLMEDQALIKVVDEKDGKSKK